MRARALVLLIVLVAAGAACRSPAPILVQVDLPGVSPFPPGSFAEIVVTDFREDAPLTDFNAGLELQTYLAAELGRAFDGTVTTQPLPPGPAPAPVFWQKAAAGRDRVIFVTGSVHLTSQVRKAVQDKKIPVDGPFKLAGRVLIEQFQWTFVVDLVVVSGETGEPLYERTYREERNYIDLEKPADFAFSDLSAGVRSRLLPTLVGMSTTERRTLLRR